jgi:hypothetical protein
MSKNLLGYNSADVLTFEFTDISREQERIELTFIQSVLFIKIELC